LDQADPNSNADPYSDTNSDTDTNSDAHSDAEPYSDADAEPVSHSNSQLLSDAGRVAHAWHDSDSGADGHASYLGHT
jgi:hypothetical protein